MKVLIIDPKKMKVLPVRNIYFYKIVEVEVTNNGQSTNVSVSWQDSKGKRHYQEWDGEFGEDDFVEEFGFKLKRD
jgi:hypothetical protein